MKVRSYLEVNERMGLYIKQVRVCERVTQEQLCNGLCSRTMLSKIESGTREADKLLTDAFLQRLGKPVERFERILGWEEFEGWKLRQKISRFLRQGDADAAKEPIEAYLSGTKDKLEQQFAMVAELNRHALLGAAPEALQRLAGEALRLTLPGYGSVPLDKHLFNQIEGCLILAFLELKEQSEGMTSVENDYRTLLDILYSPRYERREQIYLSPYVACHVIEADWHNDDHVSALAACERALADLTAERSLFAYDKLLTWKHKLLTAMGRQDRNSEMLLEQLGLMRSGIPDRHRLLAPYEERGNVFCMNDVLRTRRRLLGITQEDMSDGICDVSVISAIENRRRSPQNRNRRALLKKVHMSGERYDCELISDRFEDYLTLSRINRMIIQKDLDRADQLLSQLRESIDPICTNIQYIRLLKADIRQSRPEDHPDHISIEEYANELVDALRLTLPLGIDQIGAWPACALSINEQLLLVAYASECKIQKQDRHCLRVLSYLDRCMDEAKADAFYYEDLYTRVDLKMISLLGDMGRYEESDRRIEMCVRLALEHQNTVRLAFFFYDHAWNNEKRLSKYPKTERERLMQNTLSLFRLAYAAALISGDKNGEHHIFAHCAKTYGIDLRIEFHTS